MTKRIDLAAGDLNGSDRLTVELTQPADTPPTVAIVWPQAPTMSTPANYDQIAATAMRLLAAASTAIAQLKARRQL
jgi:hypothetical protein